MPNSQNIAKLALISAVALSLMSCTKEESGTLLGGIGGALIGSAVTNDSSVGVILGTLAGAYIGRDIGRKLDDADQQKMYQTTQGALETGVSGTASQWHNPDSGNSGTITPQPSYNNTAGQYCREYQQTVTIAGEPETAYGTACRQPDGSWKIVNS
ncbi:MAG: glycine zipper 2TM domain-containing protein [Emcibacteraceae bacterium]|nr:glycine zipper 2TM domain-containing protein [Emcibacteraceae bacterium]